MARQNERPRYVGKSITPSINLKKLAVDVLRAKEASERHTNEEISLVHARDRCEGARWKYRVVFSSWFNLHNPTDYDAIVTFKNGEIIR